MGPEITRRRTGTTRVGVHVKAARSPATIRVAWRPYDTSPRDKRGFTRVRSGRRRMRPDRDGHVGDVAPKRFVMSRANKSIEESPLVAAHDGSYPHVFVSYSRAQFYFTESLVYRLQANNFLRGSTRSNYPAARTGLRRSPMDWRARTHLYWWDRSSHWGPLRSVMSGQQRLHKARRWSSPSSNASHCRLNFILRPSWIFVDPSAKD